MRSAQFLSRMILTFIALNGALNLALAADPNNPLAANDAPDAGALPRFMKPGMRLLYREGSSVDHGVYNLLDQPGPWNWKEGTNTGGVGFLALDILHASPDLIAAQGRHFLMSDLQRELCTFTSAVGVQGGGDKLDPYWINPARLANIPEGKDDTQKVNHVRYTLNGHEYNAISILQFPAGSYRSCIYDLDTGLLLSLSQQIQTPNGKSIEHAQFVGMRQLAIPWADQPPPQWIVKGAQLTYQGSYGATGAAGMPPMTFAQSFIVRFDDASDGCFSLTCLTRRSQGAGAAPTESTGQQCSGSAMLNGLWIPPDIFQKLQPNQVIDEDQVLHFRTTFVGIQGNAALFVEQGPFETKQLYYNTQTGTLVGVSTIAQNQIGQQFVKLQLVDQR